jgi:hypothetical protein
MIMPMLSFFGAIDQQIERRPFWMIVRLLHENFRLVQRLPDEVGRNGRKDAEHEHSAPADDRQ